MSIISVTNFLSKETLNGGFSVPNHATRQLVSEVGAHCNVFRRKCVLSVEVVFMLETHNVAKRCQDLHL
jgi:hypothetical protein